jgi:IS4 transposase
MTQVAEFKTVIVKGVTFIGRRQIEAEYNWKREKAHRILVNSGLTPIKYFNKLLYNELELTAYLESIYVFKEQENK